MFGLLNIKKYLSDKLKEGNSEFDTQIEKIEKKCIQFEGSCKDIYTEFKKEWNRGSRKVIAIMDEVRDEYRSFTRSCLKQNEHKQQYFSLDNLIKLEKQCDYIYACILLKILGERYETDLSQLITDLSEDYCSDFAAAWHYVIGKDYKSDVSEVAKYKREYLDMLNRGNTKEYYKQQRILSYIEKHASCVTQSKSLWNCWLRCVQETFDTYVLAEMNAFVNPKERLPDMESIEKSLKIPENIYEKRRN